MHTETDSLKHIGLQFFAEGEEGGEPSTGGEENGSPTDQKTFTQEQLSSMLAREKRTARQALLKELGIEPKGGETAFAEAIASIKKTLDEGKSQQQRDKEAKAAAEASLAEEKAKTTQLELKIAALSAGAKPDSVSDLLVLAASRIDESNTAEKVFADLKTKYPTFFGESAPAGTGGSNNPPRHKGGKMDGIGKRLANTNKSAGKSSYFKNN